jgi:hypothetical protein
VLGPEHLQYIEMLEQKVWRQLGISQLQSVAMKPTGLNSGEAIRAYEDSTSQRFQHVVKRWHKFHLDVADLMIECAREAEERGDGSIAVMAQGDKDIEEISFSEVAIEKNKYSMRVWPTSLLPDTPSGKLQTIKELGEAIPEIQQYLPSLLDIPDLENVRSLMAAPLEIIDKTIDRILEKGEAATPDPTWDLALARQRATLSLLRADNDNYPEERLELLRVFLSNIDAIQAMQEQDMMAQQMPQQAPPEMAGAEQLAPETAMVPSV